MTRTLHTIFLLLAVALAPAQEAAPVKVSTVARVGLTVEDLDREAAFFTDVLSFEKVSEREVTGENFERMSGVFGARARIARLRLGDEEIELTDYLAPEGRPIPADSHSNDLWFQHIAIIVSDMDAAYTHLRAFNVRHASTGPQTIPAWNKNAGGIRAFYFKDPEGHVLEVLWFPEGKGDPKWQAKDRLFLGIDHTAIVVSDTEQSLRFYRDTLGMHIAGGAENYGIEQERLNNVFGARLRITTLKADSGPGVELLEYIAPGGGRLYPLDSRANDLWQWQTTITAADVKPVSQALFDRGANFISPGVVEFNVGETDIAGALLVRDPDGHAIAVVENSKTKY